MDSGSPLNVLFFVLTKTIHSGKTTVQEKGQTTGGNNG
jgi:hypothetical protein